MFNGVSGMKGSLINYGCMGSNMYYEFMYYESFLLGCHWVIVLKEWEHDSMTYDDMVLKEWGEQAGHIL